MGTRAHVVRVCVSVCVDVCARVCAWNEIVLSVKVVNDMLHNSDKLRSIKTKIFSSALFRGSQDVFPLKWGPFGRPPHSLLFRAPEYCGCPAGTHHCDIMSRVPRYQSASSSWCLVFGMLVRYLGVVMSGWQVLFPQHTGNSSSQQLFFFLKKKTRRTHNLMLCVSIVSQTSQRKHDEARTATQPQR